MKFTIKKKYVDPKIQLGFLMVFFVVGCIYNKELSLSAHSIVALSILTGLLLILIYPYVINCLLINYYRVKKNEWVDYKYLEFGDNGLFFSYEDKDIRFDSNITEMTIKKVLLDYVIELGNKREIPIPTEKSESWKGEMRYSFMYLARLLTRVYEAGLPIRIHKSWSIQEISDKVCEGLEIRTKFKEANFKFDSLLLSEKGLKIDFKEKTFVINPEKIKSMYVVKTPKNYYWLSILGFKNTYLICNTNSGWMITKI